MAGDAQLTPMMAQYRRIKTELPKDALLLFRLGDFYELFFEDAIEGAQLLNVALTKRGVIPMCGIPFHAANGYIARILKAGRKVAICDQMEEARPGQLVKREVTQILSPGTHFDDRLLAAERNNFLAALNPIGKRIGLAIVDLTTGDFKVTELDTDLALTTELERLRPAELIYPEESSLASRLDNFTAISKPHDAWVFAAETAQFTLREHFKVASLDGFGLRAREAAIGAAGAIVQYLAQHLRRDVKHLTRLSFYQASDFLTLDSTTLKTLEVLEPLHSGGSSLFSAMNRTATPMGARKLRDWLALPLAHAREIHQRQDAVATWMRQSSALEQFRAAIKEVRDLERTISRISIGTGNARDLQVISRGLSAIPCLRQLIEHAAHAEQSDRAREQMFREDAHQPLLAQLAAKLTPLPEIVDLLNRALVDDPPLAVKEGNLIRDGFDPALDELRAATRDGKDWIAKLQQDEIERTGISSLKVRFNSVFGYYIEITKSNLEKVPIEYVRKQTIANGERFITPALKEVESKILGAEERSVKLEYDLFLKLREAVIARLTEIQTTASALAELDVLGSFAETARLFGHTRPEVREENILQIEEGRHPVLDQALVEERFVPNDTSLFSMGSTGVPPVPLGVPPSESIVSETTGQIALITGPNMAGKSTYIRQVALLSLLAHTGAFIPAKTARIDLIDRIFTRIGASDDLARGQSTFMVEMCETANILNNATARSLIILDEIGRGTSTFDGLSLAWSIVEHLHNQVGAKTLFATHYHELTELAARLPRVRNYNVAVREWNDQIIFLRKIVPGGADKSYGIQVARLAGVPRVVIDRAKEILINLEEAELTPEGKPRVRQKRDREKLQSLAPAPQLDLFNTNK